MKQDAKEPIEIVIDDSPTQLSIAEEGVRQNRRDKIILENNLEFKREQISLKNDLYSMADLKQDEMLLTRTKALLSWYEKRVLKLRLEKLDKK